MGSNNTSYIGFEIPFPPTVNHMYAQVGTRKVLTKEYRAFIQEVGLMWKVAKPKNWSKDGRFGLIVELTYNNKRRNDVDNRVKATQDALTRAGVWQDDAQVAAASARWLLSVNKTRAAYGLAPLVCAPDLDTACEAVANNCASTATLAHGTGVEIIAYNYSGIDAACGQWLNSPAHRALLLSPSFKAAGVAVVKAQDGRFYCVVKFR